VQAACSKELSRAAALLEREPSLARFDLFAACVTGELEVVESALLKEPALATREGGPNGWTPIVYACFSRFLRRGGARAERIVAVVRRLLEAGANPNDCYVEQHGDHAHGQTCLYAAAGIANHPELTRLLLDAGADVNERVPEPAREALYHAAEFRDVTCLALLLAARPDPAEVTHCLGRMLDFDNERGALLFLEHGADPNHKSPWAKGRTHLHKAIIDQRSGMTLRAMLERGADPNVADNAGKTPYAYAIRHGYAEAARLLEEFGASPTSASDEDRLVGALVRGERAHSHGDPAPDAEQLCLAARKGDLATIQRLLAAGADASAPVGVPPLHSAGYAGQLEAARVLVDAGASLTQENEYGGTPLGTTIYGSLDCCDPEGGPGTLLREEIPGQHTAIVELLIERGSPLPQRVWGSEAIQAVLRHHGVPEVA
jgi:ankyrin repeat protein